MILITDVDNSKSQGYIGWDTDGGKDTRDKVFLLSYAEALEYFKNNEARKCVPTEYAIMHGAWTSTNNKAEERETGIWWLRSPGLVQRDAAVVISDGSCGYSYVNGDGYAVRPVLWVDLDSGVF